jgi:hypothetical protein
MVHHTITWPRFKVAFCDLKIARPSAPIIPRVRSNSNSSRVNFLNAPRTSTDDSREIGV